MDIEPTQSIIPDESKVESVTQPEEAKVPSQYLKKDYTPTLTDSKMTRSQEGIRIHSTADIRGSRYTPDHTVIRKHKLRKSRNHTRPQSVVSHFRRQFVLDCLSKDSHLHDYNSYYDKNLYGFFSRPAVRKQLRKYYVAEQQEKRNKNLRFATEQMYIKTPNPNKSKRKHKHPKLHYELTPPQQRETGYTSHNNSTIKRNQQLQDNMLRKSQDLKIKTGLPRIPGSRKTSERMSPEANGVILRDNGRMKYSNSTDVRRFAQDETKQRRTFVKDKAARLQPISKEELHNVFEKYKNLLASNGFSK